MRKRRKWIILLAVGLTGARLSASEPQYQGRSLTDWASQLDPHSMWAVGHEPAEIVAIQRIGTNAIPILLRWISQKDPPEKPSTNHASCFDLSPGQRAEMAFGILGAKARPAIPTLTQLAMTLPDRERYDRCINALSSIGPDSLPSFQTVLTQGRTGARWSALSYLPVFHSNAVVVLPAAILCLSGTNAELSWKAADELSRLDVPSTILVSALTNALPSAAASSRARILRCLFWLHEPARNAVPAIRNALTDRNRQVRQEATNALLRIAPQVLTNAPPAIRGY